MRHCSGHLSLLKVKTTAARRGMVLVIVLTAIALIAVLCATSIRTTLLLREHVSRRLDRHQAELLALGALDRAASETTHPVDSEWSVELRPGDTVRVSLHAEPVGDLLQITSRATIPSRAGHFITASRQLELPAAAGERP